MTPRISRSRGGETAIDPDELSGELLTDVGASAPGRYAGQVERLDAGTIGNLRSPHASFNRPSAFDKPSVESLTIRGDVVGSIESDSTISILSRVAAASKNAKAADVYLVSNEPPVSIASIFEMDASCGKR